MEYWLDALLAVPLLWMLYKGFTRGFIMEIARLIALISGVYLAARFSTLLAEYVYKNTSITYEFLPIIAFAVILISVLVLAYFFAKTLEGGVKMVAMGWANKAAGAFFGFARGAFLLSLLLLFVNRVGLLDSLEEQDAVKKSFLFRPIQSIAPFTLPILEEIDKDAIVNSLSEKADEVEDSIREIIPE